jgi:hypothetical protein
MVAIKDEQEVIEASKRFSHILAFTGSMMPVSKLGKPFVNGLTNPKRIVAITERSLT